MHEVITNAEQVTPEWLTSILYERGYLSQSNAILVQEIDQSQHTSTWFADISFLEISYLGKAPKSVLNRLCLKIPKPDLRLADLLYGRNEVEFYNTIANAMDDPPLARCYDAVYSPDTGRSVASL